MNDTSTYKQKLEKELSKLEAELGGIAVKTRGDEWQVKETLKDEDQADENVDADALENFSENRAIVDRLSVQYADVKAALEKIAKGTYGTCEVGGEAIDEKRLAANPSARTCIAHAR